MLVTYRGAQVGRRFCQSRIDPLDLIHCNISEVSFQKIPSEPSESVVVHSENVIENAGPD